MVSIRVTIAPANYDEVLETIKKLLEAKKKQSTFKLRFSIKTHNVEIAELNNEGKPVVLYQTDLLLGNKKEQISKFFSTMIQIQEIQRVPSVLITTSASLGERLDILRDKCSGMGFGLYHYQKERELVEILIPRFTMKFEENIIISDEKKVYFQDITRAAKVEVADLNKIVEKEVRKQGGFMEARLANLIGELKSRDEITLENLERILIQMIYDFVLKNPKYVAQKHRSITQQRKKVIKNRDNFCCQICDEVFKEEELVVDHIYPHSLGGSNKNINLMALCKECNSDKNKSLNYYRSDEGRNKIILNIEIFVRSLTIISDFNNWLIHSRKS